MLMSDAEIRKLKPKVLIPEVRIQERVAEIAQELNQEYQGKEITAVCILKGSLVFFTDLIRHLDSPLTCEFLGLSSYGDRTTSSGEVKVTLDMNEPVEGRHLLVIEDIVDTGLTLDYILNHFRSRRPASLKTCSLLCKRDSLKIDVPLDYVGFDIGQEFVMGYGIDYAGRFRGLPYVGYVEQEH
jgi:hypoxanthine phosphoribosyltransferase